MSDEFVYNSVTTKVKTVFGLIFDNISIVKEVIDNKRKVYKVPIHYSPAQKFLARFDKEEEFGNVRQAISLPLLSFELKDMRLSERKESRFSNYTSCENNYNYIPAPVYYDYFFELRAYGRTEDDVWQITEQILPIFNPSYTIGTKKLNDLELYTELTFFVDGVELVNDYEGSLSEDRRMIYNTFNFKVQVPLFQSVVEQDDSNIIKKVTINLRETGALTDFERLKVSVDPLEANEGDDYNVLKIVEFVT